MSHGLPHRPASPEGQEPSQQQAEELLASKGLDFSEFNREFAAMGELSPQSYDKLLKSGIPQTLVDGYIEGQRAIAERGLNEVYKLAGGSKEYAETVEWARENLDPSEIAAYDRAMSSGDMGAIKVAVKGLRAQYMADPENKPEPTLIGGDRPRSDGSVFQSSEEVVAAVRDPRYKTDKAYRDAYEKKLARSDVFGQGRG
jgi:hypothetical protein